MRATFEGFDMTIYQNDQIVFTGDRAADSLYHLHASVTITETAFTAEIQHKIPIAHRRMGHVSLRTLRRMQKKQIVRGLKLSDLTEVEKHPPICRGCVKGKIHRISFSNGRRTTCIIGELVHSDVGGPMSFTSINGERYYVIFKDDFSGYVKTYFLKKKSEVFSYYRLLAAWIKNQTGLDILTLRSDGGGEFKSKEFSEHLATKGTKHETSCANTPSQNGVSERFNRTVMETARCMLHSSNAPLWLWSEAIRFATYILNRVPSKEKLKTPHEILFREIPDVSSILQFGAHAYILALGEGRKKIDDKSLEGMLVGFDDEQKGYRIYVPSLRRIVISIHVKIDENRMYTYEMKNPVESSFLESTTDPFVVDQVN